MSSAFDDQQTLRVSGHEARSCLHCGHSPVESYCGLCGQPTLPRFETRDIVRHWLADLTNLDRGFLYTVYCLSTRPGHTVRDYLRGHTRPYTHPLRYLLIFVALATFVTLAGGVIESQWEAANEVLGAEGQEAVSEIAGFTTRYFNLLLLLAVPLLALFSRWLFRRSGDNFAEHFIFNVYMYAHQNFIYLVIFPLVLMEVPLVMSLYILVITTYYIWACVQFFPFSRGSNALRAVGVTTLAYVVYYILLGALIAAYVLLRT